jgi:hypothetical protein
LFLVFLKPVEGVAAPLHYEGFKPSSLIANPCLSSLNIDAIPIQFVCKGVTEGESGRAATITFPTPHITARVPKLSIIEVPTFLRLSWDPASFSYSDLIIPEYEFIKSGVKNKLINVHYELRVSPVELVAASEDDNNFIFGNVMVTVPYPSPLQVSFVENHENLYKTILPPFCDDTNNLLLSNIPIEQGGYHIKGGGCQNLLNLLPQTETIVPAIQDGYEISSYPYGVDGQVLAYWTEYASTQGTSRVGSHPAFALYFESFWQVEARVSWDMHLIKNGDSGGGEEIIDCRWEYWEDPDAYIDRSQYPPFCKRIVTSLEGWELFCKPGSEDKECNYFLFGNNPDHWWREIETDPIVTVLTPDGEYTDRYSFVVLQAQPLLDSP